MSARVRDRIDMRDRLQVPRLRQRHLRDNGKLSELRERLQLQHGRRLLQQRVLRQTMRRQKLRP